MKLYELSIEQVAEALGLSVCRHRALCPFHNDSNPSLTFSVRKNRYRCFVCGASGGPIDLVMNYLHKPFLEACHWLSSMDPSTLILQPSTNFPQPSTLNPKPFDASRYAKYFERPWLNKEAQHFLFEERHIDPRVVRYCRLTSWIDKHGTPWLQTPYFDRDWKLIGIQNRNLSWNSNPSSLNSQPSSKLPQPSTLNPQPSAPRFKFPRGAQCSIYNLPVLNLLKPDETLFITEGCSDCWAMLSSGHKAIAIPSATLLSKKDKEQLSIINSQLSIRFAMYPDQDVPGERLFLQLQKVLPSLVRHQLPAGCKDYSEYYLKSLTFNL